MLAAFKRRVKDVLRRAAGFLGIRRRPELFGVSYWYEGNLWEPPVQIALRDLCKPGHVVFDVGANFGGLTMVMSRMVGPKGVVCAFEASPRIVDKCQRNVVHNGCHNVQVYHAAVYSRSRARIPLYFGTRLNDSIYGDKEEAEADAYVTTLALDDFVGFTRLTPHLVKMDIEGAEFDAVTGMLNTIAAAKPHLILETQPADTRCLDLLLGKGYRAIDLNSYREIRTSADYPQGVSVRNNLYIHNDRLSETPYQPPFSFVETKTLAQDAFRALSNGSVRLVSRIALTKGRYLIDVDFRASGEENEMMCGVKVGDTPIFQYHAYTKLLAQDYKDWVIDLHESSEISLYFDFINGTRDDSFSVRGAKISRIVRFDALSPPFYI